MPASVKPVPVYRDGIGINREINATAIKMPPSICGILINVPLGVTTEPPN